MERRKTSDYYRNKILDCLSNEFFGLSITNISHKLEINRNTVSKYLNILEAEGKVFSERLATATVYFSKQRTTISYETFMNVYKTLMVALKDVFPNNDKLMKKIGNVGGEYPFIKLIPFKTKRKKDLDINQRIEMFKDFIDKYRIFFEYMFHRVDPKDTSITIDGNKVIYRMENSNLLEDNGDFIYHYYMLAGFFETRLSELFKLNIKCNVVDYKISKKKGNNYIILEFEYPDISK